MTEPVVDPSLPPAADPVSAPATPAPAAPAAGDPPPATAPSPAAPPSDPAPPADDGSQWREKLAGGDEKLQKLASRYTSPKAVLEALAAAQGKIRSGTVKPPPKADAPAEEVAAWRAENGIPDEPTGYKLELPDGLVLGEADKPVADSFIARMHAKNAPPELVSEAVGWYLSQQEEMLAARDAFDEAAASKAEETLREEYGRQYKPLVAAATQLIPEGIREAFLDARLDTGERVGNNAQVIRWLAQVAAELNPQATVVPGSGTNAAQAIESELIELKKMMGDHNSAYWKGPEADKNQARYRELVAVQSRIK